MRSTDSRPKSARACTGSSTREMSELRPASVMQRKKIAQRNWPTSMLRNKIGILGMESVFGEYTYRLLSHECHITSPDECESCVCRTVLLENTYDLFLALSLLHLN